MAQNFDAYKEWLKIPPQEQPPHHYRLLGIQDYESDQHKIDAAVNQLVARLQSLSHGPHVEQAQQILNQVAKARLCLTDPTRKAEYDRRLRAADKPKLQASATATNLKTRRNLVAGNQIKKGAGSNTPTGSEANADFKSSQAFSDQPAASSTDDTPKPPVAKTGTTSNNEIEVTDLAEQSKLKRLVLSGLGLVAIGGLIGFLLVNYLAPKGALFAESENGGPTTTASGDPNADMVQSGMPGSTDSTTPSADRGRSNSTDRITPDTKIDGGQTAETREGTESQTRSSRLDQFAASALEKLDQQDESLRTDAEQDLPQGVFSPLNGSRFANQLRTTIQIEAVAVEVKASNSGSTNYIFFADRNDDALMVFALRDEIDLNSLQKFSGKRIRVNGRISKRGQELGIQVKDLNQIKIVQ